MKEKKKDWIKLLEKLCHIYSDYTKKNNNSKLEIIIDHSLIEMFLYKNDQVIDKFRLCFTHKERYMYNYISMSIMKIFFSGSIVYNKDNIFYNDKDIPNIEIIVNDKDMLDRLFLIAGIYSDINFYDRIDSHRRIRNRINRYRDVRCIQDKIELSKELLGIRR